MDAVRGAWVVLLASSAAGCNPTEPEAGPSSRSSGATGASSTSAVASPASASSSSALSASPGPAPTAPGRPLYYDVTIPDAELSGRTLRELTLMRNTIFARAGNSFRKPWLDSHFRAQPWYTPLARLDESKISALDRANARAIAGADASITQASLETRRDEVLARRKAGTLTPEDEIELSLLSQRLGTWLGEGPSQLTPSPLEDPSRLDKLLHVDELSTLSRRDLRILRNTIYARRGRAFDSAVVKSFFEGATWYRPRGDYHEGLLSEVDRKNIGIVRSVESSLGGPEHENPSYGADGWFFQA